MKHEQFMLAVEKTEALFNQYIEMQQTRFSKLSGAQAPSKFMSMAVTTNEELNATSILENLGALSIQKESHTPNDEHELGEYIAQFMEAFKIQSFNVTAMATFAPIPAHTDGASAVQRVQSVYDELLAIDGVLDILHPAQQSWHSKNNHDGALHVKAFCTVFAGKISRDIVKCKKGLRDIIAERREFNAALVSNVDASVHIEVSELTKMSNRLSNEQRDLYPDPELGGSFTPTFNMLQECLDTAVDTVPMLAALQTLNISSTPAAIAEAEATAKIEEDEAFTVAARNKLS